MNHHFEPGSLGFHEFVDRACLFMEVFDSQLAGHPVSQRFESQVALISEALFRLYQDAASVHAGYANPSYRLA